MISRPRMTQRPATEMFQLEYICSIMLPHIVMTISTIYDFSTKEIYTKMVPLKLDVFKEKRKENMLMCNLIKKKKHRCIYLISKIRKENPHWKRCLLVEVLDFFPS